MKKILSVLLVLSVFLSFCSGCGVIDEQTALQITEQLIVSALTDSSDSAPEATAEPESSVIRGNAYSTPEDVALYLHLYKELPPNYLTKSEAEARGWVASKGNLWKVTDHMSIGGDRFGNREGLLPSASGRKYYECDVNFRGGTRGAERIIFSNDGLIYYTADHYASFTLLYGEE